MDVAGGHTAEMLRLLASMDLTRYTPRDYVAAETDAMCEAKLAAFEKGEGFDLQRIPRSREVAQSWVSSLLSTIRATLVSIPIVINCGPDLVHHQHTNVALYTHP